MDTTGAQNLGMECMYRNHWVQGLWSQCNIFTGSFRPNIALLELLAITMAFDIWIERHWHTIVRHWAGTIPTNFPISFSLFSFLFSEHELLLWSCCRVGVHAPQAFCGTFLSHIPQTPNLCCMDLYLTCALVNWPSLSPCIPSWSRTYVWEELGYSETLSQDFFCGSTQTTSFWWHGWHTFWHSLIALHLQIFVVLFFHWY